MVVRAVVEHVPGRDVGDAHQRIVGRVLILVAKRRSLRHAVEPYSRQPVGLARRHLHRRLVDHRLPGSAVLHRIRRVDLDIGGAIGGKYLSARQHEQIDRARRIGGGIRNGGFSGPCRAIEFKEADRRIGVAAIVGIDRTAACGHQDVAVRQQRARSILHRVLVALRTDRQPWPGRPGGRLGVVDR